MGTATAAEIATELRAALAQGPAAFLDALHANMAEQVDLTHVPAAPGDGVSDRDALHAQFIGLVGVIPEFRLEGDIDAAGSEISFAMTMSGTTADGTRLSVTDPAVYTVVDGCIVSSKSWPPPDAAATFERLLAQGASETH